MIHNYKSLQVWEALEALFPDDIEIHNIAELIYNDDGIPAAGTALSTDKLDIKILRTARTRVDLARVKIRD